MRGGKWYRSTLFCGIVGALLGCTPSGYVLHVDNRASVPYGAVNERLKQRVLRTLIRHGFISATQSTVCGLNIMEIDRFYLVEVWPDGVSSQNRFGIRLTKPFLSPAGKYADCKQGADPDSCVRANQN